MNAGLSWQGLDPTGLAEMFDAFGDAVDSELESAAEDIGARLRGTADELAPVDEGRLSSSIEEVVEHVAEHIVQVIVGTNVEYAPYQEFGTAKMAAQPYLRPALEQEREWIVERLERAVKSAASSVGFGVSSI